MPTPQLWGPEILVNTPPDNMQSRPELFALDNGGFVAAYASYTDTGCEIRAQIFDAEGAKIDDEFVVNTTATGYHTTPAVTVLDDGRFVVTWASAQVEGEQLSGIRARIFNEDGTTDAAEFYPKVEWYFSDAISPSIAALTNGGFAVAYTEQYGDGERIEVTFYDAAGNADPVVRDFVVNDPGSARPTTPSIAGLSNGSAVVVYVNEDHSGGRSDNEVRGRIITATGEKGVEFTIPTITEGTQIDPTVTALSGDRFVVVWTHWNATGAEFPYSIKARVYASDGTALSGEIQVDVTDTGDLGYPVVSALPDGGFAVAYADTSSGDSDIHLVTFDSTGVRASDEVVANAGTMGRQWYPTLTTLANGRLVVGWQDEPGDDWNDLVNIRAQILDLTGEGGGGQTIDGTEEDDTLNGTDFADVINGLSGNDYLDGGLGADEMRGGAGDDSYIVDTRLDRVIEAVDGGRDGITVSGSLLDSGFFSLAGFANVEELWFGGTTAARLTGNGLANQIFGGMAADTIDGAIGADMMAGFLGNDTYIVDDAGDSVSEIENGGFDTVHTSVSFALGDYVEALVATGAAGIALTGNALANTLRGNDGANVLNGGVGGDVMFGGAGNDTYYVDSSDDRIVEWESAGIDHVITTVSQNLWDEVENLSALGSDAIALSGNSLNNKITGNAAANRIDGRTGTDTMDGGLGDDSYIVDAAGDEVIESTGGGTDTILTSVNFALSMTSEIEHLTAAGDKAGISLRGNTYANTITGNSGANKLHGGLGNDQLKGGSGKDTFVFDTRLNKRTNVDKILDFRSQDDSTYLHNKDFTKLGSGTVSKPRKFKSDMFVINNKAKDREDRIVYDKKTGALYYDQDGTGSKAQVKFATISNKVKLAYHDFFVI